MILQFNKFRYFLIEGGRDSAKTQSVARFLLYLAEKAWMRIVCGREIMNTIEESVFTVLKDLVLENELNYEVFNSKLIHRDTNSLFRFKGFRDQGLLNIKGLEGAHILWIDEAQAITKATLDVIIPTIRKEKSKIFFTMNRYLEDDPVFVAMEGRPDCLHIHVDYRDNPHCPEAMKYEAEMCDPADYAHIWLGQPMTEADNHLIPEPDLKSSYDRTFSNLTGGKVLALDPARYGGCYTAFCELTRGVGGIQQTKIRYRKKFNPMSAVGECVEWLKSDLHFEFFVVDSVGLGGPLVDRFLEIQDDDEALKKIKVVSYNGGSTDGVDTAIYVNHRGMDAWNLKDGLRIKGLNLLQDKLQQKHIRSLLYTFRSGGQKHILSKEEMRTKKLESPDCADALRMAYSVATSLSEPEFVGTPKEKNTKEFWDRVHKDMSKAKEQEEFVEV